MKVKYKYIQSSLIALLFLISPTLWAFDSGSTGTDGALTPLVDTEIQLPPDGVFNYTSVNIPSGVTVTFARNTTNTPVVILASGDVTIDGTLSVAGSMSAHVGASGDGALGDDGLPGLGGPGGFDGGTGGAPFAVNAGGVPESHAGYGLGPGAGEGTDQRIEFSTSFGCGGGAGAHATNGGGSLGGSSCDSADRALGGTAYGVETLLPLIGGSGGGGATGGLSFHGTGGGGGGGAILIAVSGTTAVNGTITANGGRSGDVTGTNGGGTGGGGGGGAIRIITTAFAGNGALTATGGAQGNVNYINIGFGNTPRGGAGGLGRIRTEYETTTFTGTFSPAVSVDAPGDIFVSGMPSLAITTIGGVAVPASPTGNADVVLPDTAPNPVTVDFATTNVPLGNTIQLTLTPPDEVATTATSGAIAGTVASGTASTSIDVPDGPSTLAAELSFTVVADAVNYEDYSRYADGQPVERIILRAGVGPQMASTTTFVTKSGKEYTWASNTVVLPN